jgi:two-component system chemotaxis response regulator CheY
MLSFENLRVVLIDDSRFILTLLREMLREVKIKSIVDFTDAENALLYLNENIVDLVITDYILPGGMSGLDLSKILRRDKTMPNPFVPIIMISAHTQRYLIDQGLKHGVDEILAKPISPVDLYRRIQTLVCGSRQYIQSPDGYFGPERRRRQDNYFPGPNRRRRQQAVYFDPVTGEQVYNLDVEPSLEDRRRKYNMFELD